LKTVAFDQYRRAHICLVSTHEKRFHARPQIDRLKRREHLADHAALGGLVQILLFHLILLADVAGPGANDETRRDDFDFELMESTVKGRISGVVAKQVVGTLISK